MHQFIAHLSSWPTIYSGKNENGRNLISFKFDFKKIKYY